MKPLRFVASALNDLRALPAQAQKDIGFALYEAQLGGKSYHAKPLKGFKSAGVLEVVEDLDGEAFRAVYTVKLADAIYVLHVFQKKSKRGIATPQADMDLIRSRLKQAQEMSEEAE